MAYGSLPFFRVCDFYCVKEHIKLLAIIHLVYVVCSYTAFFTKLLKQSESNISLF